jgi:hypothetical protein
MISDLNTIYVWRQIMVDSWKKNKGKRQVRTKSKCTTQILLYSRNNIYISWVTFPNDQLDAQIFNLLKTKRNLL